MHDVTARPLDEAQRVLETVFKRLLDTAYATTHLGFCFTTDEQLYAEQLIVEAFNRDAKKARWDVRLEQFGPALPDMLYKWDGMHFRPASGAAYAEERWRRLGLVGLRPPRGIKLRLHHEYAKRNGKLVARLQGPVISKPSDGKGWALEYRPVGGLQIGVGDVSTIKLKRGEWLSDTFALLWLLGDALRDAPLWATGPWGRGQIWAELPAYQRMFRREAGWQWDRRLRKRVFWQRFDQVFRWSAHEAEQAQIRLGYRDFIRLWSSDWWVYHKPYRPHFWNVKDYREWNVKLRLKTGGFIIVDRQKGGPVQNILVTPALAIFYLWLWRRLLPTQEQRRLESFRRYYKIDCWLGDRSFDTRASAYLQLSGVPNVPYGRFDQRPSAYLYPAHAPKHHWKWWGGEVICLPPRDRDRLRTKRESYNAEHGSYWNSSSMNYRGRVDVFHGGYKSHEQKAVLSEKFREQRGLNIPRETLEVRNNMIKKIEDRFMAVHCDDAEVV